MTDFNDLQPARLRFAALRQEIERRDQKIAELEALIDVMSGKPIDYERPRAKRLSHISRRVPDA